MINVSGRSYDNGIRFVGNNYQVRICDKPKSTEISVIKNKISKDNKFVKLMKRIPFIRGFINVICSDRDLLLIFLAYLVFDIVSIFTKGTGGNTSLISPVWGNIIFASMLALYLGVIIYIVLKCFRVPKVLFQYHGAEHKVIAVNDRGKEVTMENCKAASRVSDNCGTMLATLIIVSIIIVSLLQIVFRFFIWDSLKLFLILTLAYELFLVKRTNIILRPIFKCGYFMQERLFTKEPNTHQLVQAMLAFAILEGLEEGTITIEEVSQIIDEVNAEK